MSIPGSASSLFLATAAGGGGGGYSISRSLRFNSSDSAYCGRSFGTPTTQGTFTFSAWVKRSALGSTQQLFGVSTNHSFGFTSGDALNLTFGGTSALTTTAVFRDPGAWYHIVWTQSGTSHTIYVNNVSVGTATATSSVFNTAVAHQIGAANTANYFNGYLADIHFIDGQALTPSSFAETNSVTGQWVPKAFSGGSYGTNGFKLTFSDNSNNTATTLGKDTSGNGNNWTPFNLQTTTGGPSSVAAASGALPIYNTTDTYGATKGSGTRTDSNSSSIVLAIPMDGTNNGTTFTDESATIKGSGSAKTITRVNAITSTTTSKFYGSSGSFNGSSTYLSLADSADWAFGSGDFTVETWAYLNSGSLFFGQGNGDSPAFVVYGNTVYIGPGVWSVQLNFSAPPTAKWFHFALVRSGNTLTVYIDGVASGSSAYSSTWPDSTDSLTIGEARTNYMNGYLQDFRIYKGVAKYTSNFNPPSSTQNATIAAGNDSLVDTPTSYGTGDSGGDVRGNFCTWSPLDNVSNSTLSNGNLDITNTGDGAQRIGSMGVSSGKWYYEFVQTTNASAQPGINSRRETSTYDTRLMYYINGQKYNGATGSAYGATWTTNDVIGIALDLDAGTLVFYKNGVSQGTAFTGLSGTYYPWVRVDTSGSVCVANFGQRPFAYPVSGYKAWCDTNLPAPVVAKSSTAFDVVTYTGNGSARSITGLAFNPDLVWIKSRSAATDHTLYDAVRGAQARLESNNTDPEVTSDGGLTAFNNNGFTLGTLAQVNTNAATYVAWCWDEAAADGFDIVTYTGNGANRTIAHSLGVSPSFMIVKQRTAASATNWAVWHSSLANTEYLLLNSTAAKATGATYWNSTSPTASNFSLGTAADVNTNNGTYVAYLWSPVVGYSSFGSYTGNGSSQFVYLGFRPRWLLIKNAGQANDWFLMDSARSTYNEVNTYLYPNSSGAEATYGWVDFLSNGFKVNNTGTGNNNNGITMIYAAFAESPFQYARAR